MTVDDINNRFTYHPPTPKKIGDHEEIRDRVRVIAHVFDEKLPDGREKSLALTKLEEAVFWANAAIARHGY